MFQNCFELSSEKKSPFKGVGSNFYRKFHIFAIDALNFNNNNGENRINFRLLVFELLAFEDLGSFGAFKK